MVVSGTNVVDTALGGDSALLLASPVSEGPNLPDELTITLRGPATVTGEAAALRFTGTIREHLELNP